MAFKLSEIGRLLVGEGEKPLRLFSEDGRPVTDRMGKPLSNISRKQLIYYSMVTKSLMDWEGRPLVDKAGRRPSERGFQPTEPPPSEPDPPPGWTPRSLFDMQGFPLTDPSGSPLVNSRGQFLLHFGPNGVPVSDLAGGQIIDVTDSFRDFCSPLRSFAGQPLILFDDDRRPLTYTDGSPCRDIRGCSLVLIDRDGVPIRSTYGSDLFDAQGRNSNHADFDPTIKPSWPRQPPFVDKSGDKKLIFDQRGLPITDLAGIPLTTSDGNMLITNDPENKILLSFQGLDLIEISLTRYKAGNIRSITNVNSRPARLFNRHGKPITNWLGEPLKHADGRLIIKFDDHGIPLCDFEGHPIYDEYGKRVEDPEFSPYDPLGLTFQLPRVIDEYNRGISLFDGSGMPLTDERGYYLLEATRRFMLKNDEKGLPLSDWLGRKIYSESGLPLIRSLFEPIIGAKGTPCRLFDHKGSPLTCNKGFPIKLESGKFSIRLDKIGRIIGDFEGNTVYDSLGTAMTYGIKFNANSEMNGNKNFVTERSSPIVKERGNLNTFNVMRVEVESPALKEKGIFEHFQMEGGDNHQNQENKSDNVPKDSILKTKKVLFSQKLQLFDMNFTPLSDQQGNIMKMNDKFLAIKFDIDGKIISDFKDGDVFDAHGIPLTKTSGFWRNAKGEPLLLFDSNKRPLTDIRGKELYDINGRCLLVEDKFGRPVFDVNRNPVFDCSGTKVFESGFDGAKKHVDKSIEMKVGLEGKMLRLFDEDGRPLTDEFGSILFDSDGNCLAMCTSENGSLTDLNGCRVFDPTGVPAGCHQDSRLETMTCQPYRLFNSEGEPLTDYLGTPLKFANETCLVVFDMFGRPIQDCEGEPLRDVKGRIIGTTGFSPEKAPQGQTFCLLQHDGTPLRLFNASGRPLTDQFGYTLLNADGKSIVIDSQGMPVSAPDGGHLYNEYGSLFEPKI